MDRVQSILFENFRLDRRGGFLFRLDEQGVSTPVALGSRAFDLLSLLIERKGELVSKDTIMEAVWSGRVVEEANLNVQIARLRQILDADREQGSCIKTVPGRGYCFVGSVRQPELETRASVSTTPHDGALVRPRLSIVVLPFANLSEKRDQQYFADGITDDLTTDLSRIEGMFVISRNTAFMYRNKPVDTKQIGRKLGVRYVLEGSIRRLANRVRVNAQLIDAETDSHLWADRFECDMGNLFTLQNEITTRIAVALNLELIAAEVARSTEHPDVLDWIFRGRAVAWQKPLSAERCAEAIGYFEHALELDPESVCAQSWLATMLANRALDFPTHASGSDIEWAQKLAINAVAASPRSAHAHFAKGQVLRAQNRCEEAIPEYETVLELNRNWVGAIFALSWCKFHTGSVDEMIPALEQVFRLSPRDPYLGFWYGRMGVVHLLKSRTEEAIVWFEKARSTIPERPFTRICLAAAYALKGDTDRAAAELAEGQRLSQDGRYSTLARLKAVGYFGAPKVRALFEATFFVGLSKAGMPEI
jgi:TolB-like protein